MNIEISGAISFDIDCSVRGKSEVEGRINQEPSESISESECVEIGRGEWGEKILTTTAEIRRGWSRRINLRCYTG